jgi:hypothetical protein
MKLAACSLLGILTATLAAAPPASIRVATYNATLNRFDLGAELNPSLADPSFIPAKRVAEIVQRARPDVLFLNEFDYTASAPALGMQRLNDLFFNTPQAADTSAITFPHRFTAPVNTGIASGMDLDNNGSADTSQGDITYGNDALGFGRWPGQYGMAVFSKFPILESQKRTFQNFKWKDMPGAVIPPGFYTATELLILRLSSKSHWDLPIDLGSGCVFHLLGSHPTPPVFDGAEDRNGRRNHDEIRLWADYLSGNTYLKDDANTAASLADTERFIVTGDLNADPSAGDSFQQAALQLLRHPRINAAFTPTSAVGGSATAAFASGNLRADYALPSLAGWKIQGGGVFWPAAGEPGHTAISASDHRLVWLDLTPVPVIAAAVRNMSAVSPAGSFRLRWTGAAAYSYGIQSAPDLQSPWTAAAAAPSETAPNEWQFQAPVDAEGRRFYRIVVGWRN